MDAFVDDSEWCPSLALGAPPWRTTATTSYSSPTSWPAQMARTMAIFLYVHAGLDEFSFKSSADYYNINIVGNCIELNSCTYLARPSARS